MVNTAKEHVSKKFDADLEEIRTRVLQMGGFVEEQIKNAVEALTDGNEHMIEQIIDNDHRVNAMEIKMTSFVPRSSCAGNLLRSICA